MVRRIPRWLLRHHITVERPGTAWGLFEGAEQVRCFVGEAMSGATVERIARISVYAEPGTSLPAGSRVTLPDGRRGYISAVVVADGGGLPTPDHVEAAVEVGSVAGPAYGETVVILRRTALSGRDRYGNQRWSTTEIPVGGVAVRPLSTDESLAERRDRVVDTLEVILPPDTQISATDRLRIRGLTYEVDGTPDPRYSPDLGIEPGVRVLAKRVTG